MEETKFVRDNENIVNVPVKHSIMAKIMRFRTAT